MSKPALIRADLNMDRGKPLDHVYALRKHDAFREPVHCDLAQASARWLLFDKQAGTLLLTGTDSGTVDRVLVVDAARSEIRLNVPTTISDGWVWGTAWYELRLIRPGHDNLLLAVGGLRLA